MTAASKFTPEEFRTGDIARAVAKQSGAKWPCKECSRIFDSPDELIQHEKAFDGIPHPGKDAPPGQAVAAVEEAPDRPGIYQISDETYHGGPGFSRSQLWTAHNKTPFHMRYGVRKETDPQRFGDAVHVAVLEPGRFEAAFYQGPDDRRGKKWDAANEIAAAAGKECLTSKDYDNALRMRDAAHRHPIVRMLTKGTPAIEQSAYYVDESTGELCKVRPDIYSYDVRVMADLKSTASALPFDFQKSIANYGYHVQGFQYPLGFEAAAEKQCVDGFVFIAIEKDQPNAVQLYELEPGALDEGRDVYSTALDNVHLCSQAERTERRNNLDRGDKAWPDAKLERYIAKTCWPGFTETVAKIDLPQWGYVMRPVK